MTMQLKPAAQTPPIPTKPQIHTAKHHCTYNGIQYLPIRTWVRTPTVRATWEGNYTLVYEIRLYYKHNRACTIYRSWDDFMTLRRGLCTATVLPPFDSEQDLQGLHDFLEMVITKRRDDCALEYFLRRRMEDCGGS